jgi:hypothetical protein
LDPTIVQTTVAVKVTLKKSVTRIRQIESRLIAQTIISVKAKAADGDFRRVPGPASALLATAARQTTLVADSTGTVDIGKLVTKRGPRVEPAARAHVDYRAD